MPDATAVAGNAGRFEQVVMPHLDAAYNLARWLVRNTHDAEDIVQESYLRAYKFFGGFQGGDARPWLLKIVRNTSYSFLEKNRPAALAEEFDERVHVPEVQAPDVEASMVRSVESRMLREALEELPVNFREGAGVARAGRAFVQGNWGIDRHSDWHRDVEPGARPRAASRIIAARAGEGGHTWFVTTMHGCCTAISTASWISCAASRSKST